MEHNSRYPRVVLNADDLGMHSAISDAIFALFAAGHISSSSIMATCPDFGRSAEIAKAQPEYAIGVHATLTCEWQENMPWKGLLGQAATPSLYNENGLLWRSEAEVKKHADAAEVRREIKAQIEKVIDSGIKPTHLDGHMYAIYQRKDLMKVGAALAEEFKLAFPMPTSGFFPLLRAKLRKSGLSAPDEMHSFYLVKGENKDPGLRADSYERWFKDLKPGLHHLAFHPALERDGVSSKFFDMEIRMADKRLLGSGKIEAFVKAYDVILTNYRESVG